MRRTLLAFGALALAVTAAWAQGINTVPQIGTLNAIQRYSTWSVGNVPTTFAPASAATDVFCIRNSSSKAIAIKTIDVAAYNTTAVAVPVTITHHVVLDSGGTAATSAVFPAAVAMNSAINPATTTAGVSLYTANPTINDTAPLVARSTLLTASTSATVLNPFTFLFGEAGTGIFTSSADLPKGITGEWCVSLNTTSVTSLAIDATWIEN